MNMTQRFFSRVSALAAFALALTAFGPQAHALKTRMDTPLGEISLAFDTVASVGISLRTKSRDNDYISPQNGGSDFVRQLGPCLSVAATMAPGCLVTLPTADVSPGGIPRVARFKNAGDQNLAGGGNQDDGRLNFDKGDITALTLKVLADIQADLSTKYGEFTAFMRIQAYADPVLRDGSFYERVGPDDAAKRELGRDIKILDGYLSWDWDLPTGISEIGDLPFNLRVGKLTTNNWGESTFALNGIAASIVIDVPSARRAGAEIREIIQPEYMVYGSIGLPFDISVDAYYQFHHTIWNLDVSGSPTATSDVGNPGNEIGGFLLGSSNSTTGTFRRNCDLVALDRQRATASGEPVLLGNAPSTMNCLNRGNIPVHYTDAFYEPQFGRLAAEQWRLELGETNNLPVSFVDADDQGQWGVRLSYYLDSLYIIPPMSMLGMGGMMEDGLAFPGIEFTFSYQNVHSRVPYTRVKSNGLATLTVSVASGTSTATAQALTGLGCAGGGAGLAALFPLTSNPAIGAALQAGADITPAQAAAAIAVLNASGLTVDADNPLAARLGTVAASGGAALSRGTLGAISAIQGGVLQADGTFAGGNGFIIDPVHFPDGLTSVNAFAQARSGGTSPVVHNNALSVTDALCAIFAAQSAPVPGTQGLPGVGSENLTAQFNTRLELYYPEDIRVLGFGFNTTIPWLEWGLQSEVSWRPDQPFQVDTTEQIIAVAWSQCVHWGLGPVAVALNAMATQGGCDFSNPDDVASVVALAQGRLEDTYVPVTAIERSMINFVIGTTALYNNSNPIVNFLGADQAVVLSEFNLVHVDNLPQEASLRSGAGLRGPSLACVSRSGTELPLGGILGLDGVGDTECTPNEVSMGYTIFGFMDYNNVFGTAWRLRPSLAVRHAVSGNTPAPINSWREDTLTTTFAISAAFQNTWNMRMSYVAFFDVGSNDYNGNSGNDSWSFNISYAF